MNTWLTRAVGTAGLAGGFLLLSAAQAQAAPAEPELLPLADLRDGGLPLLSDLLGDARSTTTADNSLLGGLISGVEQPVVPHPAAQVLGADSAPVPSLLGAPQRSELDGGGGLLGTLTGLGRPSESPRQGISGLPGFTMLSALTGQQSTADRAAERPVASQAGRHRAKPSPTRTRTVPAQTTPRAVSPQTAPRPLSARTTPRPLPAQTTPRAVGAHRADDGPRHAARPAAPDDQRTTSGPRRHRALSDPGSDRRKAADPGSDRRASRGVAPAPGRGVAPDPGRGGGTLTDHPANGWTAAPDSPSDDGAIAVTPAPDQGFGRAPAHRATQAETPAAHPAESPARARPSTRPGERPVAGVDPDYS
ncbi:hypothetical protein [Catenuloplanes atrovinosus]|uniref:Uncharacterized protein n=1 Tax=Catenuloplanes atrovinosus TaxID=137266 RepID=A0AAE3YUY2_9ACTN|nr:hypothetical protein [Catenuloplanes atrovinosus]MDR7280369.1 hypothetical protein [Catenuloplanes atrovinosus]